MLSPEDSALQSTFIADPARKYDIHFTIFIISISQYSWVISDSFFNIEAE